jgi:hypothetical protein
MQCNACRAESGRMDRILGRSLQIPAERNGGRRHEGRRHASRGIGGDARRRGGVDRDWTIIQNRCSAVKGNAIRRVRNESDDFRGVIWPAIHCNASDGSSAASPKYDAAGSELGRQAMIVALQRMATWTDLGEQRAPMDLTPCSYRRFAAAPPGNGSTAMT